MLHVSQPLTSFVFLSISNINATSHTVIVLLSTTLHSVLNSIIPYHGLLLPRRRMLLRPVLSQIRRRQLVRREQGTVLQPCPSRIPGTLPLPKPRLDHRWLTIYAQWNGWIGSGNTNPTHPRSQSKSGYASLYGTRFLQWDNFFVGESETTDPATMLATTSYPNSLNWNEMRDLDSGGPKKYILRPVKIRSKKTQWLWIE